MGVAVETLTYMPEQYAALRGEDMYQFTLRVDLGPGASVDRIASCTDAVRDLIDLGERWAIVFAHDAAARALLAELLAQSEPSLAPLRDLLDPRDEKPIWGVVNAIRVYRDSVEDAEIMLEIPSVLSKYADAAVPGLLRPAVRAEEISYRNPLEWVLVGGGFAVYATVQALRMVRDWSARKRTGAAAAVAAEAQARAEVARADVLEYLAGRGYRWPDTSGAIGAWKTNDACGSERHVSPGRRGNNLRAASWTFGSTR